MLKTHLLGVCVAVACSLPWGQAQGVDVQGLPPLSDLVFSASLTPTKWRLAFGSERGDSMHASAEQVAAGIEAGITYSLPTERARLLERQLRGGLVAGIRSLSFMGGHVTTFLLDEVSAPFGFFEHDGQAGVLFTNIGVGAEFNTLRLSEVERVQRVLYDIVVPSLPRVVGALDVSVLEWVGVAVTYGANSFADDFDDGNAEVVLAIFPVSAVQSFSNLAMTDRELVGQAVTFSGSLLEVRRVDVNR